MADATKEKQQVVVVRVPVATKEQEDSALLRIQKARTSLIIEQPFFGALVMRLKAWSHPLVPTMGTNGKDLVYNPLYVEKLSLEELQGVICHEVLHCAAGHPWRRGERDKKRYNDACDMAINPIVLESGLKLPPGGLDGTPYKGLSSEEIYVRLMQQPPPPQGGKGGKGKGKSDPGDGQGSGGDGDRDPDDDMQDLGCGAVWDAEDMQRAAEQQADWQVATAQAAQVAKQQGKLPACLERFAGELLKPRVDWRTVLRRFIQQAAKADYSWRLPNQRYLAGGLYMPGLRSETMGHIVVAIDTSGSIGQRELDVFAGELNGVVEDCKPEKVTVLYCDAQVHGDGDVFENGDPVELHPMGGGGTDFRPVFDHVDDQELKPVCLIYLTDLWGTFPEHAPAYPVLWATLGNGDQVPPWGEHVELDSLTPTEEN